MRYGLRGWMVVGGKYRRRRLECRWFRWRSCSCLLCFLLLSTFIIHLKFVYFYSSSLLLILAVFWSKFYSKAFSLRLLLKSLATIFLLLLTCGWGCPSSPLTCKVHICIPQCGINMQINDPIELLSCPWKGAVFNPQSLKLQRKLSTLWRQKLSWVKAHRKKSEILN